MEATEEYEACCQRLTADLLRWKHQFAQRKIEKEDDEDSKVELPKSPSFEKLYRLVVEIDKKERFLLELKDQIRQLEHEQQLKELLKRVSLNAIGKEQDCDPLRKWYDEMMTFDIQWNGRQTNCRTDREFFDIKYDDCQHPVTSTYLSFGSRRRGSGLRVTITRAQEDEYGAESTFGIKNLSTSANEYVTSGKSASEFVHDVVWKELDQYLL